MSPLPKGKYPLVLVTGSTGFIASHLIKELQALGKYRIRGTVRSLKDQERKIQRLHELVPHGTAGGNDLEVVEADLCDKDCWREVVQDCDYVCHLASPASLQAPGNENDVIGPAMSGTVNIMKACADSHTVERVVLTSSTSAIALDDDSRCHTEEDWTEMKSTLPAYVKSKIRAEQAAWDFVSTRNPSKVAFDLVVLNPGLVVGAHLMNTIGKCGSFELIKSILNNETKAIADIMFSPVHVKDVAKAHILAMEMNEAAGKRHIITANESMSLIDIADVIHQEFTPQGYTIPTKGLSKVVLWPWKFLNKDVKLLYTLLGRKVIFDNQRMRNDLGLRQMEDVRKGIIESCYSLIELGLISKK